MSQLKIAIIGGGPVSLTLANILQNNDIPFTVFEASTSFRTSGGSLDLHPSTGQLALREAGLWDAFVANARPESDCLKIVNVDGEILWDENLMEKPSTEEDKFAGRPEIDRRQLMQILFDNLNKQNISFGKKLSKVTPSSTDSTYTLEFADGSQQPNFTLVVGGDGAWSKVRNLLTDTKPHYSGISCLELWCTDIHSDPWLLDYVGAGSMFTFSEGRAIIAQRQGDGSLRTYVALQAPQEDFLSTCGIDWTKPDTAREELIEQHFSHVGADLKRTVLSCKDALTPRPLYELPVDFTWTHREGVTLIGDAAHVMTPFAGVGVNVGMTDALVLGKEIVAVQKGERGLDEGLKAYEAEMFVRARKNAEKTAKGKKGHFSKDGAKNMADMMKAHHQ